MRHNSQKLVSICKLKLIVHPKSSVQLKLKAHLKQPVRLKKQVRLKQRVHLLKLIFQALRLSTTLKTCKALRRITIMTLSTKILIMVAIVATYKSLHSLRKSIRQSSSLQNCKLVLQLQRLETQSRMIKVIKMALSRPLEVIRKTTKFSKVAAVLASVKN